MLSTCLCFQGLIASWYHQDRTVTIHFFAWLGLALSQEFRLLFLMLNSCASNTTSAMAKHFDRQSFVLFICQFDWFLIILLLLLGNGPFFFLIDMLPFLNLPWQCRSLDNCELFCQLVKGSILSVLLVLLPVIAWLLPHLANVGLSMDNTRIVPDWLSTWVLL